MINCQRNATRRLALTPLIQPLATVENVTRATRIAKEVLLQTPRVAGSAGYVGRLYSAQERIPGRPSGRRETAARSSSEFELLFSREGDKLPHAAPIISRACYVAVSAPGGGKINRVVSRLLRDFRSDRLEVTICALERSLLRCFCLLRESKIERSICNTLHI